jgi:hypothetical protein
MTITNGYTDLASLKARLGIPTADTADDTTLDAIVEAVSRQIEAMTYRRFYRNSADEDRYYVPEECDCLWTDDIGTITTLKTDEADDGLFSTTWATTDYESLPYNASVNAIPVTHLRITRNGNHTFPVGYKSVKITGKFGFSASTPKPVAEACLLQSARLFRRKDAPFGVVGGGEMGQAIVINKLDPDVEMLLRPFMRLI